MISLTLYTTIGCHLCELADTLLNELSNQHNVVVEAIEIGDDDELVTRYGTIIPVVRFADNSELNWPFTLQDLEIKIGPLSTH
ncbi:MAG: glutaredoxin family protein [Methylophagaceae bacterium]